MDFPSDDILLARGKVSTLNRKRRHLMKELQTYCQRAQAANLAILSLANESKVAEGIPKVDELVVCAAAMGKLQTDLMVVLGDIADCNVLAWGESRSADFQPSAK